LPYQGNSFLEEKDIFIRVYPQGCSSPYFGTGGGGGNPFMKNVQGPLCLGGVCPWTLSRQIPSPGELFFISRNVSFKVWLLHGNTIDCLCEKRAFHAGILPDGIILAEVCWRKCVLELSQSGSAADRSPLQVKLWSLVVLVHGMCPVPGGGQSTASILPAEVWWRKYGGGALVPWYPPPYFP
jgi:hypothetical protein